MTSAIDFLTELSAYTLRLSERSLKTPPSPPPPLPLCPARPPSPLPLGRETNGQHRQGRKAPLVFTGSARQQKLPPPHKFNYPRRQRAAYAACQAANCKVLKGQPGATRAGAVSYALLGEARGR